MAQWDRDSESERAAHYTGHGRKPASGPWPQDGKRRGRRGGEGAGPHIRRPGQGTQRLPASRQPERRPGPRDGVPGPDRTVMARMSAARAKSGRARRRPRSLDRDGRGGVAGVTRARLGSLMQLAGCLTAQAEGPSVATVWDRRCWKHRENLRLGGPRSKRRIN